MVNKGNHPQLEEFHADFCQQQKTLKQFFDLNLQLQTARAQVSQQDNEMQFDNLSNKQDLFCNWTISSPWTFPTDIGDDEVLHTAWSLQWSVAILNWMENCRWPLEPTEGDPGLSWVELALSLALSNQMWLPVKRLRAGQELILQPITADETESLQLTLAEQGTVAYSMVTQIMGLVVKRLIPQHVTMGKVPSLYWQGSASWTTGFRCRPQFDNQRDVYMILQKLFLDGHGIHCLPFIEFHNPNQLWTEDLERGLEPFEERSRKMKLAMRRVRTRRKDQFLSDPLS